MAEESYLERLKKVMAESFSEPKEEWDEWSDEASHKSEAMRNLFHILLGSTHLGHGKAQTYKKNGEVENYYYKQDDDSYLHKQIMGDLGDEILDNYSRRNPGLRDIFRQLVESNPKANEETQVEEALFYAANPDLSEGPLTVRGSKDMPLDEFLPRPKLRFRGE